MSCLLTNGNTLECGKYTVQGGIASVYLANVDQLTSITDTNADTIFDLITMVGANVFYKFDFNKDGAMVTQANEYSEGRIALKQTLSLSIPNYDQELANTLGALTFSRVIAVVEFRNGKKFILGYGLDGVKTALESEAVEMNSGRAMSDFLGTVYTLSCFASTPAPEFLGTVPV